VTDLKRYLSHHRASIGTVLGGLCVWIAHPYPTLAADRPEGTASATGTPLEEVLVTARRREENIQQTPISISAYSGAALEARGIDRSDELAQIVPNLVYQENPGAGGSASNAAILIRGIGQADFIPTVDPGVGLYVDGVYVASTVGSLMELNDIDRVEVERGPQGTLFGRNTIGGAVNITTLKPTFDAFGGSSSLTGGTDNRTEAKMRINVPLTATLAASISAGLIRQGGYVDEVVTQQELGDNHKTVGRLSLRWQDGSHELSFSIDGTQTRENGAAFVLRSVNYQSALFNPQSLPLLPPGSPAKPGFYVVNPPADIPVDNFSLFNNYLATLVTGQGNCLGFGSATYNPAGDQHNPACYGAQYAGEANKTNYGNLRSLNDDDLWGGHLTWDWNINAALRFKLITAYRHLHSAFQRDGDESPLTIYQLIDELSLRQFSEEAQLEGESLGNALKWVGGLYYFDESSANPNIVDFAPVKALSGGDAGTQSIAAFAQATYDVTSQLALTAGARYTRDKKTFLPIQAVLDSKGGPFPVGLPLLPQVEVEKTFSKPTPLLNAAYRFTPDIMGYATFSQGFKSGGFTQRVFPPLPATPAFGPETATAYEMGLKTSAWDNRLRVNTALYLTNYDDIQVQVFQAIAPITANGGQGRIQGLELEMQASPGAGWLLEANAGLTDAKYTRIDPDVVGISIHSQFAFVSRWTGTLAAQKEINLGGATGRVVPRIEWSYRTKYFNDALDTPTIAQPGYGLLNGSAQWLLPGSGYSVTAGLKNALDKNYLVAASFTPGSGINSVIPDRGREWYVTVRADF
jgi:iron complex outermembrane recepter protein